MSLQWALKITGNLDRSMPNQLPLDDVVPAERRVPHTPYLAGFFHAPSITSQALWSPLSKKRIIRHGTRPLIRDMFLIYVFLALAVSFAVVAEGVLGWEPSLICSNDVYGRPELADSAVITEKLPFVKNDPDGQLDAFRLFAEPGLFQPRFSALKNPYASRMVQLPAIWRFSKLNR